MRTPTRTLALVIIAQLALVGSGATATTQTDVTYRKFEEYDRNMNAEQIKARLDGLAETLRMNAFYRVYIMSYGGRHSCRNEAILRAQVAIRYLSQ